MTPRILGAVAVVALALAACGQEKPPSPPPPPVATVGCTGNCKVDIMVTGDCTVAGNITANPPSLPVHLANTIHWNILPEDQKTWTFADPNGIAGLPTPQFHGGHATGSGKRYQIDDDNTDSGEHKYTVNLQAGATACAPLDPIIRNGQ